MKLSIITINYNDKIGLKRTIDSVVAQTFRDFEWIVIDGGSTDGSRELIELNAEHFAYWVSESDKGIYNAMNKGIAQAKGEYLQFLNSGDWFYDKDVLGKVFGQERNEDILFSTKHVICYGDERKVMIERKYGSVFTPFNIINQTISHQSAFIKRNLFEKIGLYDETYKIVSDRKFFFEAFLNYHVTAKAFNFVVVYYDADGVSNRMDSSKEKERLLCEFLPQSSISDYYEWYQSMNCLSVYKKENQHAIEVYEELRKHRIIRKIINGLYRFYKK